MAISSRQPAFAGLLKRGGRILGLQTSGEKPHNRQMGSSRTELPRSQCLRNNERKIHSSMAEVKEPPTMRRRDRVDELLELAGGEAKAREKARRRGHDDDFATSGLRASPMAKAPRPAVSHAGDAWLSRIDTATHPAQLANDGSPTPTPLPKARPSPHDNVRAPAQKRDRVADVSLSRHNRMSGESMISETAVRRKTGQNATAVGAEVYDNQMASRTAPDTSKRLQERKIYNDYTKPGDSVLPKYASRSIADSIYEAQPKPRDSARPTISKDQAALDDVSVSSSCSSSSSKNNVLPIDHHRVQGRTAEVVAPVFVDHEKPPKPRSKRSNPRRLTFTPNGGPKLQDVRQSSESKNGSAKVSGPQPEQRVTLEGPLQAIQHGAKPKPEKVKADTAKSDEKTSNETFVTTKASTRSSAKSFTNGSRSKDISDHLPEAQVVHDPAFRPLEYVSGPSTDQLHTEEAPPELPILDEGDSYADLATQAAMEKAQLKFQNDFFEDTKIGSPEKDRTLLQLRESPRQTHHKQSPKHPILKTPEKEPLSTQAMFDEMSPFALTTIKKRSPHTTTTTTRPFPPTSLTPTKTKPSLSSPPTAAPQTTLSFPPYSPSMATSSPCFSSASPPNQTPTTKPLPITTTTSTAKTKTKSTKNTPSHQTPPSPSLPKTQPSPSTTKTPGLTPLSALPSFSIKPDGTFTENESQDGQRIPMLPNQSTTTDYSTLLPELEAVLRGDAPPGSSGRDVDADGGDGIDGGDAAAVAVFGDGEVDDGSVGNDGDVYTDGGDGDGDEDGWDMAAAIEDAGSFLGEWNVDIEARREGRRR